MRTKLKRKHVERGACGSSTIGWKVPQFGQLNKYCIGLAQMNINHLLIMMWTIYFVGCMNLQHMWNVKECNEFLFKRTLGNQMYVMMPIV